VAYRSVAEKNPLLSYFYSAASRNVLPTVSCSARAALLAFVHQGLLNFLSCGFYCAVCVHSADYAIARCLSVCPSHASILSKWLPVSPDFFRHHVVGPFWLFHTKRYVNIPMGTPYLGCQMQGGMEKIADFLPLSRFMSKTVQLLWKANRKPYPGFRMVPFPMILSDP